METLLNVLLAVKFFAYLAGIASFTLMCAIGVVMAVDEIRGHIVPAPLQDIQAKRKRRKQLRWQKEQEELAWADFFIELPHNFLPDGAILRPQEPNRGYFE